MRKRTRNDTICLRRLPVDQCNWRAAIALKSDVGEITNVSSSGNGCRVGNSVPDYTFYRGVDLLATWNLNLIPSTLVVMGGSPGEEGELTNMALIPAKIVWFPAGQRETSVTGQ